jgi:hypothetical protein
LSETDVQGIEEGEKGGDGDVGVCEGGTVGAGKWVTAAGAGLWYHDGEVGVRLMRVVRGWLMG